MAFYNKQTIRDTLAVMEKGSVVYFDSIMVTFNLKGEFNVFRDVKHIKYSTTKSLKEVVDFVHTTLN